MQKWNKIKLIVKHKMKSPEIQSIKSNNKQVIIKSKKDKKQQEQG